jgi:hypothetical protein
MCAPYAIFFRVLAETAASATDALDAFEGRLAEERVWLS